MSLRLVGLWQPQTQRHHLYLTNAAAELLGAKTLSAVYALRWEIELVFRELKHQLRIEDMPSGNLAAVRCLLYAALLSLAFSRRLAHALCRRTAPAVSISTDRCTCVFRALAPILLQLLVGPPHLRAHLDRAIWLTLRREAPDPNRRRLLLRQRSEAGIVLRRKFRC